MFEPKYAIEISYPPYDDHWYRIDLDYTRSWYKHGLAYTRLVSSQVRRIKIDQKMLGVHMAYRVVNIKTDKVVWDENTN